ncbi:hypothetical protein [Bradyrhizobium elkanii]|uniref:hypothetical protein n=1 Tax=Bradyrhizobium elkanii TaxID=29448 RepID=UPI001AE505A5|nr:hypothetical protein [Bradyrhizobium elkanii]MBP2431511.1 hypothetical protein [Bradyrhizobium elkanii]WLA91210.1 hypothetical protein QNJ96_40890 [Bradyrhizobium elkanii]
MNYRNYSTVRENGRYVAFDPNEPEIFRMYSVSLKRLHRGIDAMWLPAVGNSGLSMSWPAPRWRRQWSTNPVGEVDLGAENARGAC